MASPSSGQAQGNMPASPVAEAALMGSFYLIYDDPKHGKAQPLTARVLTPFGWVKMGDLHVGDTVVDPDGGTGRVEGIFPQGTRPIYKVTTSDGGVTEADADHLWLVTQKTRRARGQAPEVLTTREILDRGVTWQGKTSKYATKVWFLPIMQGATLLSRDALPLDPYFLGVLLGDGSFRVGVPSFSTPDPEIVESCRKAAKALGLSLRKAAEYDYRISGKPGQGNVLTDTLRSLGLWDKLSTEKRIPDAYMIASYDARLRLLQGLMDTDGDQPRSRGRNDSPVFNTSSPFLRDQVRDLVRSLGGVADVGSAKLPKYAHKGEERTGQPTWRVRVTLPVCPFTLPKKRNRWQAPRALSRTIASIEPAGEAECRCIKVSTRRSLYVTDDYIVTHNTTALWRFLPRAVGIGVRSAMELAAVNTCGFKPDYIVEGINDLPALCNFLLWYQNQGYVKTRPWGIIDDLSHVCKVSMLKWQAEGRDNFYAYRQLDEWLVRLGNQIRQMGMIIGASCHLDLPEPAKRKIGGPEVPSRNQMQSLPGWADFVGRGGVDPTYPDLLWQRTIMVDPQDEQWITGDRFNVAWRNTPLNLREIVRASKMGYHLPRVPGLEWQEQWAQVVCDRVLQDASPRAIEAIYMDVFRHFGDYAKPGSQGEMHVQWAIQDGIARAVIQRHHAKGLLGQFQSRLAALEASAPPPVPGPPGAPPGPPGSPGAPPGSLPGPPGATK